LSLVSPYTSRAIISRLLCDIQSLRDLLTVALLNMHTSKLLMSPKYNTLFCYFAIKLCL